VPIYHNSTILLCVTMSRHTPKYSKIKPFKTIYPPINGYIPIKHYHKSSTLYPPPKPHRHRQKLSKNVKKHVRSVTRTHFCLSYPILDPKNSHFDPQNRPGTISTPKIAIPILKCAFSSIPHARTFRTEILPPPTP